MATQDVPALAGAEVPVAIDDRARFSAFYRSTRDPMVRALAVTLRDVELAADAVDEAMARAYQRWSSVGTMTNAPGWVYRVAFNWACTRLRSRGWRAESLEEERDAPASEGPSPAEPSVARALAELEVRQRSVVVCRHLLGWSEAETAAALRVPIGTVKSRLHRATRLLAVRLSHLRPEEGS